MAAKKKAKKKSVKKKTTRTRARTARATTRGSVTSPLPSPRTDVPRGKVHEFVRAMLLDARVGDVDCREQDDRLYTIVPHPSHA